MQVNWKCLQTETPILYSKRRAWTGFDVRHLRILPGELVEQTFALHELNITLAGSVTTEKHTAAGAWTAERNQAGNVCFTPAGQPFRAAWESELECLTINLDPGTVAQAALEQNLPNVELVSTDSRHDLLVQHIGLALLEEAGASEPFGRLYAESLANTLILHLLKNYSAINSQSEKAASGGLPPFRLRRAKDFIEANLETDFTLAELAAAVGFSQFHFARAFRRSTGLSVQQYATARRISRAKELLASGDLPLVEVSLRAGFKSQSHFTTVFHKTTAHTPKQWRAAKHR